MDRKFACLRDGKRARKLYQNARELLRDKNPNRMGAVAMLRESVLLVPHYKTCEILGETLLSLGFASEAVVYLAAAAGLNRQLRAKSLLAKALLEWGDPGAARMIAKSVLEECPGNRVAAGVLASVDDLDAMDEGQTSADNLSSE